MPWFSQWLTAGPKTRTFQGHMPCSAPCLRVALPNLVVLLLLCAGGAGCAGEDLGECDPIQARRVVFDDLGVPAYAGQAQVQVSCGNGGFCHSAEAEGRNRSGAPGGLNFDMIIATTGAGAATEETDRLRSGLNRVIEEAELMLAEVRAERMPPFGAATIEPHTGVPRFEFETGGRLPLPDTFEGQEIFRNWLACGAPVVERTTPRPPASTPVGDIVPGRDTPLEATFSSLYTQFIFPTCGSSCHGPTVPSEFALNMLDLSEQTLAYNNLVNQPAQGSECGATSLQRVVPNDADNSLLLQKLANVHSCGDRMPSGGTAPAEVVTRMREWINAGAAND